MNQPPPIDRRLQRQIIFAFMFFFAVALFVRPDPMRGQVIFRVAMAAIGIVGFLVVSRRKRD